MISESVCPIVPAWQVFDVFMFMLSHVMCSMFFQDRRIYLRFTSSVEKHRSRTVALPKTPATHCFSLYLKAEHWPLSLISAAAGTVHHSLNCHSKCCNSTRNIHHHQYQQPTPTTPWHERRGRRPSRIGPAHGQQHGHKEKTPSIT